MHPRVAEFVETAETAYGLDVDVEEFPEKGTPTAADAAAAVDCSVGQIVNSLVFTVRQAEDSDPMPVLCLTSGANRIDEGELAAHFDVPADAVSMASPEQVREATGWAIGGVPPICHATAVPTLMDPALLEFDTVWAAAGTPTSVWAVDPERLRDAADAAVADVTT